MLPLKFSAKAPHLRLRRNRNRLRLPHQFPLRHPPHLHQLQLPQAQVPCSAQWQAKL
jgi:hypothetical protein